MTLFTDDDVWDSGVEMEKYLNDQGGYDYMTEDSDRAAAMQLNAQRSRRESDTRIKKENARDSNGKDILGIQCFFLHKGFQVSQFYNEGIRHASHAL